MTTPTIRTLTPAEVLTAVDWAAAEGWNPGLADATAFLAQDHDAFFGLFLGDELASIISATRYVGGFHFVGFYICRPDLRGRGLGLAVWQAAFAGLEGTVGLDGVAAQQHNYARSGFVLAHRNVRHGGVAAAGPEDARVVDIAAADRDAVAALDRACFGFARPDFLAVWLAPPQVRAQGRRALAFVADGQVKGVAVVRRCRTGFRIGPLFADDAEAAGALFSACVRTAAGAEVFIDVPAPNAAAMAMAAAAGLVPVFETARMYRGPAPELPLARIYGITSLELG